MTEPSAEALDFLQQHGMWVGLNRVVGVARLLDKFGAAAYRRGVEDAAKIADDDGWVRDANGAVMRKRQLAQDVGQQGERRGR